MGGIQSGFNSEWIYFCWGFAGDQSPSEAVGGSSQRVGLKVKETRGVDCITALGHEGPRGGSVQGRGHPGT